MELIFETINYAKYNILIIIGVIFVTSFFQKYHYILLNRISKLSWRMFNLISKFFIRLWVIIHEFSHLFFAFLFWHEIKKVELFKKNWWSVQVSKKDYLGAIGHFSWSKFVFILLLIWNRMGVFFTSLWPLIIGIVISFLLINISFWFPLLWIETNYQNYNLNNLDFWNILLLFVFWLFFAQWFILSRRDIKNLFIYEGNYISETLVWSIINTLFFLVFLFVASFFYIYFLFFGIVYMISFITVLIIYTLLLMFLKLFFQAKRK